MKRCPKCNRNYPTNTQRFCTHDGGMLMPVDVPTGEIPEAERGGSAAAGATCRGAITGARVAGSIRAASGDGSASFIRRFAADGFRTRFDFRASTFARSNIRVAAAAGLWSNIDIGVVDTSSCFFGFVAVARVFK